MKSTKKVVLLTLVTPLLLSAGVDVYGYTVSGNIISCPTAEADQTMTLEINSGLAGTFLLNLSAYNNITDALTYYDTYTTRVERNTDTYLDVLIPLKNRINGSGIRIEFETRLTGKARVIAGVLYPYVKQTINVKNYRHDPFIYRNVLLKYTDKGFLTDETFDFTDLNEYLAIEEGNILDLSNITFNYDERIGFESGDIKLHIMDYANVYTELPKTNNEITFKMKKTVENGVVKLELNQKLYVNERTLQLSRFIRQGYVATNNIYVPIGMEELFENDEIYISIENAGWSNTDIIMPFTYYYSNRQLGQCYESDYCITGGIRE